MIHFHGGPITPDIVASDVWTARHALVSYAHPHQVELAAQVSQSFCFDNGAFSLYKSGKVPDWKGYSEFVHQWRHHPGFDFCLIPDSIEGSEQDNANLIAQWLCEFHHLTQYSVPVWHLHESLERLQWYVATYPRVAIGSSGQYARVGSEAWWDRMQEAMGVLCNKDGWPKTKIHGLRMLNPKIFTKFPFSSVDSTNVAMNIGIDKRWASGAYPPPSKRARAAVLVSRIEAFNSCSRWNVQDVCSSPDVSSSYSSYDINVGINA